MLRSKIQQFIKIHRLIDPGDRVLVAYSGGADSTCLLLILHELYPNVAAVYVNHHLRGVESKREEEFVHKFCARHKIPLFVETMRWSKKPSDLEQAARKRRYRHLSKVAAEEGFDRIALAHHKNDVAETFLLNLIRGTGPKGLEGLHPRRGIYIRPLLECTREEILEYLKERRIPFFTDTSNKNLHFRRNRLRHEIIPSIEKNLNPQFQHSLLRTANWIYEQNSLLAELLRPYKSLLVKKKNSWELNLVKWLKLPATLQKPVLQMVLKEISPDLKIQSRTLLSLLSAIRDQQELELPGVLKMRPSGQTVSFVTKTQTIGLCEVDVPRIGSYNFTPAGASLDFSIASKDSFDPSPMVAYVDADQASFPLYIRNWKKGDSFQPLGMTGRKKLSDYWIDKKVPRHLRKTLPLVYKDDDLVWMAGYHVDHRYRVTPATTRLLRIELKKDA